MQTDTPALLAKLDDVDLLLEDVRQTLTHASVEVQSVQRVEETIAALKRLRWCLAAQEDGKNSPHPEAILRFPA